MGTGGLFSDDGNLTWDGTNLNATALKSATLDSATTLTLKSGGVSAIVINGSGQVAVGGASPLGKFTIGSSTGSVGVAMQPTNGTGIYAYYNTDGTYGYLASSFGTTGNKISFKLDAPDNSLVIDTNGNVGIGTSSPAYKLDVVNSSGTSYAQVKGANSGTTITTPGNGGATVFLMNTNSTANTFNAIYGVDAGENVTSGVAFINNSDANNEGTMAFMTRPSGGSITERMRINSSGDLSIGTTANIGQEKLTVVTAVDNVAAFFRNSHATSADVVLGLWTDAAKDTTNSILIGINNAQAGNGRVIDIYGNGNIQNINNSYGALSDVKLKENIVDATPKLDDLMKVKVRNYNLIGDTNKQIGVVAQELESVFAGLVEESIDTDKKGNVLGTTTKSVKYSVFVPMLIKAVQELKAEVDSLKAQLGK
jgi:hypothetical protein